MSKGGQTNVFYGGKIKKIPKLILRAILGPWTLTEKSWNTLLSKNFEIELGHNKIKFIISNIRNSYEIGEKSYQNCGKITK